MPLTDEEKTKIIEEERIRAEERAKYAQPKQEIVIREKPRTSPAAAGCLVLIIFIVIAFIIGNYGDSDSKTRAKKETPTASLAPVTAPAFDVSALLDKSLDEIEATLGKPSYDATPPPKALEGGLSSWEKNWEKDGRTLMVSYNPYTFKVLEFFVSDSKDTTDTSRLLKIGNLTRDNPRYALEFVKCLNCDTPNSYTGVKVVPR